MEELDSPANTHERELRMDSRTHSSLHRLQPQLDCNSTSSPVPEPQATPQPIPSSQKLWELINGGCSELVCCFRVICFTAINN